MTGASSSRPVVFGPADDDAFVRPYLQTLLRRSHALNTAVHQDDEMFLNRKKMVGGDVPKALCSYFGLGKQVFDAAAQILLGGSARSRRFPPSWTSPADMDVPRGF